MTTESTAGRSAVARTRPERWFQPGDLVRMVWAWLIGALALVITGALLPGLTADHPRDYLWVAIGAAVVGAIVRPLLVTVSAIIGWIAVFALAIVGQALILAAAIDLVPGVHSDSFGTTIVAAFLCSGVTTLLSWLATAGTDEAFTASLLRRRRSLSGSVTDPEVDGVVFVQLDGVSFPVLRWAVQGGAVPTIRRWLVGRLAPDARVARRRSRARRPRVSWASCTATSPTSPRSAGTTATRDGCSCRTVPRTRPSSSGGRANGRGLLADDGMSICNVFSGDAPRAAR